MNRNTLVIQVLILSLFCGGGLYGRTDTPPEEYIKNHILRVALFEADESVVGKDLQVHLDTSLCDANFNVWMIDGLRTKDAHTNTKIKYLMFNAKEAGLKTLVCDRERAFCAAENASGLTNANGFVDVAGAMADFSDEEGFLGLVLTDVLTQANLTATKSAYIDCANVPAPTFSSASPTADTRLWCSIGVKGDESAVPGNDYSALLGTVCSSMQSVMNTASDPRPALLSVAMMPFDLGTPQKPPLPLYDLDNLPVQRMVNTLNGMSACAENYPAIHLMSWIQCFQYDGSPLSEDMIRLQVYTSLAAGAKGLVYYPVSAPADYKIPTILDEGTNSPTKFDGLYDENHKATLFRHGWVKQLNSEVKFMEQYLAGATHKGSFWLDGNSYFKGHGALNWKLMGPVGVFVGMFEYDDNGTTRQAMLVVNGDINHRHEVKLQPQNGADVNCPRKSCGQSMSFSMIDQTTGDWVLNIAPGDGMLVIDAPPCQYDPGNNAFGNTLCQTFSNYFAENGKNQLPVSETGEEMLYDSSYIYPLFADKIKAKVDKFVQDLKDGMSPMNSCGTAVIAKDIWKTIDMTLSQLNCDIDTVDNKSRVIAGNTSAQNVVTYWANDLDAQFPYIGFPTYNAGVAWTDKYNCSQINSHKYGLRAQLAHFTIIEQLHFLMRFIRDIVEQPAREGAAVASLRALIWSLFHTDQHIRQYQEEYLLEDTQFQEVFNGQDDFDLAGVSGLWQSVLDECVAGTFNAGTQSPAMTKLYFYLARMFRMDCVHISEHLEKLQASPSKQEFVNVEMIHRLELWHSFLSALKPVLNNYGKGKLSQDPGDPSAADDPEVNFGTYFAYMGHKGGIYKAPVAYTKDDLPNLTQLLSEMEARIDDFLQTYSVQHHPLMVNWY